MGGRGEPRNLDDFAAVSRRISRIGPRNLGKFFAENCGPYILDGLVIVRPWIVCLRLQQVGWACMLPEVVRCPAIRSTLWTCRSSRSLSTISLCSTGSALGTNTPLSRSVFEWMDGLVKHRHTHSTTLWLRTNVTLSIFVITWSDVIQFCQFLAETYSRKLETNANAYLVSSLVLYRVKFSNDF